MTRGALLVGALLGCVHPAAPMCTAGTVTHHPRPIAASLPTLRLENLRFHDRAVCATGECRVAGPSPFAPETPAAQDGATTLPPAMAWVHVVHPGATVVLPAAARSDLLGVALVGECLLTRLGSPQVAPVRAAPWTAFLLPGGGATVRAAGGDPVAVLLVTATGDGGSADRGTEVVLHDLVAGEDLAWADGAMHARIAFDATRSPRASLGVLIAADDAPVAPHAHPGSWELLAALSASGRLHVPAQDVPDTTITLGARDRTLTEGTIAYVPAGVRHAWEPDGTHPLIAVQVYAPAGPEQRFRTLAGR